MFFKGFSKPGRIYLDFAASTPPSQKILHRFPTLPKEALFANPSGLHTESLLARRFREEARARVAAVLHAHADEIVFTSGATESDNLAIVGTIRAWREKGIASNEILVVVSELEHPAVLEAVKKMKAYEGVELVIIPATDGVVSPKDIVIPEGIKGCLVSVMYIHNELGTVQPISEIAKRVRFLRKEHPMCSIVFHTDATQAPRYYTLDVGALGVDLLSIGSTKLPMQKGVGVLYVKRGVELLSLMWGGSQEGGRRPGTEPLLLFHFFSHTLAYLHSIRDTEVQKVRALQTYFETKLKETIPSLRITAEATERAPHITHVSVPGFRDSELLVIEMDARGIALSSQSACIEEVAPDSYVRRLFPETVGVLRFSFAPETTHTELDRAIHALLSVTQKYVQNMLY